MDLYDIPVDTLAGDPATLRDYADGPMLVVNVASRCGLTPQYEGLQELHERYGPCGLHVLGVPCNQFMGQEPQVPDADGTAGDVQWNFEKFLVAPDGSVTRFRPRTEPSAPEIVDAIEAALPG